jgi:hypothetical protein
MQKFTVTLTRITTEQASIDIEAETLEEAQKTALARYDGGEFDDEFSLDKSSTTADHDDEGILSRARKIETLISVGDYEEGETGAIDMLTDLRHYCDEHGIVFMMVDKAAYGHYLHELKFDQ